MPLSSGDFVLFLRISLISFDLVYAQGQMYDMRSSGLTVVPTDIPTDTTELNLQGNNIEVFPGDVLSQLSLLFDVNLGSNRLTEFPRFDLVGNTIEIINIYYNQITDVTREILEKLTNLTTLRLQGNPLTSFPETTLLFQPSFTTFSLRDTQITTIPSLEARNPSFSRLNIDARIIQLHCDCDVAWMFSASEGRWYINLDNAPCVSPPERVADDKTQLPTVFDSCFDKEIQYRADLEWNQIPTVDLGTSRARCIMQCITSTEVCPGFFLKKNSDSSEIRCELFHSGEYLSTPPTEDAALYWVKARNN